MSNSASFYFTGPEDLPELIKLFGDIFHRAKGSPNVYYFNGHNLVHLKPYTTIKLEDGKLTSG